MKRSEIVNLIETKLYDMNVDSNGATEMVGDSLLKVLEQAGMLPPVRGLTYDDLHALRFVVPSNEQFRYYHTWDKE
jgi:hypothetical protein